jgi:release factor glutamine methyltransferase
VTIRDHITAARARLLESGIDASQAAFDSSLLARHVFGWDLATLVTREWESPPPEFTTAYAALIDRRVKREPVAYIRGIQEFWGREFLVSPAVLIPRPETELIIEETLKLPGLNEIPSLICDIGTGSGCLAVTLACELPNARVIATDISGEAIKVAKANALVHRVNQQIAFAEGRYLAGAKGPFHVIVSNPPYITESDHAGLAPEVHDYEPSTALVAGPDGLRDIREILAIAETALRPGGVLLMEIGYDHADVIPLRVGTLPGLQLIGISRDLQGIPRVAVVQRRVAS